MALVVAFGVWMWGIGHRRFTLGFVFCEHDVSRLGSGGLLGRLVGSNGVFASGLCRCFLLLCLGVVYGMHGGSDRFGIWGVSLRALVGASLVGCSSLDWIELGYLGLGCKGMDTYRF